LSTVEVVSEQAAVLDEQALEKILTAELHLSGDMTSFKRVSHRIAEIVQKLKTHG